MSPETNTPQPNPRRQPKLFPEAPPPLEEAPLPRPILRLRTDLPEPSEGPRPDPLREVFFITWKAQNPDGRADSEEFERAYGDFQIRQFEAKGHHDDSDPLVPLGTILRRVLFSAILIVAGVVAFRWWRAP